MRRHWAVWIGVVLAGIASLLGIGRWTAETEIRYEVASSRHADAQEAHRDATEASDEARREAEASAAVAREFTRLELAPVPEPAAASDLVREADELDALVSAEPAEGAPVPAVRPRSSWPPDLDAARAEVDAATSDLAERTAELHDYVDDVDRAVEDVEAAGEALIRSVADSAAPLEGANPSAGNADRLAFRAAADAVAGRVDAWDAESAARIAAYVSAAGRLVSSHTAEAQEKAAGGLSAQRGDVEAFARSIAGGVLLEFDWAPIVNGFGRGATYGGWASVPTGGEPQSTISLSDSIARDWSGSAIARAVVVHEVGHAMTSKCSAIFAPGTREESEAWATAWAIGMGYDGPGNGESLYGRPSAALIELARTCR